MGITERERPHKEPTAELIRSFVLTVGSLGRAIELYYGDIVFSPPIEEVFQETTDRTDLKVVLSLTAEYLMPRGRREDNVFFAELVNRRLIVQVQKLVAALYCLQSENLYPLHGALAQPTDVSEKAIAFVGSSGTGKGTIISRLCGFPDPNSGEENDLNNKAKWKYLAEEVLLFDRQKSRGYLTGKARTRCISWPEKKVVIEPGEVDPEGYPLQALVLLDKDWPGGEFTRLESPVVILNEVIGHANVADLIYQTVMARPCLEVSEIPVYRLGTDGNLSQTLETIDKIINQL